jgi:hypothetical protein
MKMAPAKGPFVSHAFFFHRVFHVVMMMHHRLFHAFVVHAFLAFTVN